ncbi:hypothetical protein BP6252_02221 [Coleophoma cylindrospora]|uniref:F-box domain-containing protein n=1 Tax=Coleophoma cylindrospora TaxID=1849047 RepID=A0A3D8SEK8_9HELO|nr:hypothetical protein BP6252_02221 [Coleophoma cylindrospora]
MANILAEALESLKTPGGGPDIGARRKALDSLLATLTTQEIFRLRLKLNALPTERDPCRIFDLGLLLKIVEYLRPTDLISMNQVSRTWKKCWSSPTISIRIIELHFYEKFFPYQTLPDSGLKDEMKLSLCRWLPGALRAFTANLKGRYHSSWIDLWSFSHGSEVQFGLKDQQYCNGRVAQLIDKARIRVVCLNSTAITASTLYAYPDRNPIYHWVLGHEYLICVSQKRNHLTVWSLTDDYEETVKLPSTEHGLTLHRGFVGINLRSGFIIWRIRKSLRSYNWTYDKDAAPRIIFHPYNDNIIYVCSLSRRADGSIHRLNFAETNDGVQTLELSYQLPKDVVCYNYTISAGNEGIGAASCKLDAWLGPVTSGHRIMIAIYFNWRAGELLLPLYFTVPKRNCPNLAHFHTWRYRVWFVEPGKSISAIKGSPNVCDSTVQPDCTMFYRQNSSDEQCSDVTWLSVGDMAIHGDDDYLILFDGKGFLVLRLYRPEDFMKCLP